MKGRKGYGAEVENYSIIIQNNVENYFKINLEVWNILRMLAL